MESDLQEIRKMSKEQFILVDRAVQNAIEKGDWSEIGIRPKKNCRHCLETGKIGYNLGQQRYVACKCVNIKWPEILKSIIKQESDDC